MDTPEKFAEHERYFRIYALKYLIALNATRKASQQMTDVDSIPEEHSCARTVSVVLRSR